MATSIYSFQNNFDHKYIQRKLDWLDYKHAILQSSINL